MNNEIDWYAKNDLKPTGKVIILEDNEIVINKWDYYILRVISYLLLVSFVLKVISWIVS